MKCKICGKPTKLATNKFCSRECYWQSLRGVKGDKAPNWKDKPTHRTSVHQWLNTHYGKPKHCENPKCEQKSNTFEWCLKIGKKHEKHRGNYQRMCRSCHRRYDLTPEKRKQAIQNLFWNTKTIRAFKDGRGTYNEKY